jgi:hypothetical protein
MTTAYPSVAIRLEYAIAPLCCEILAIDSQRALEMVKKSNKLLLYNSQTRLVLNQFDRLVCPLKSDPP